LGGLIIPALCDFN